MDWLPAIDEFRQNLKSAASAEPPRAKLERLAALAGHRLGFLETLQLDRVLATTGAAIADGFTHLRVGLIGSATLNQLEPGIRVAGLRRRLLFEVKTGAYGQYRQEVLAPASSLREFAPHIVLLSITARDAVGEVPLAATEAAAEAALAKTVAELRHLWRNLRDSLKATVISANLYGLRPTDVRQLRSVGSRRSLSPRVTPERSRRGRGEAGWRHAPRRRAAGAA